MKKTIQYISIICLMLLTATSFAGDGLFPQLSIAERAYWGVDGDSKKITVYPNPATNYFMLKNANKVETVLVYNILGREVKRFRMETENDKYFVNDLPKGMYVIRLMNDSNDVIQTIRMNKR